MCCHLPENMRDLVADNHASIVQYIGGPVIFRGV